MSTLSDLFKKAHGALVNFRNGNNFFFGKDGEIVYSKNNVCVHEVGNSDNNWGDDDNIVHTPGYLTLHCLNDEQTGVTLILQWLPNTTLEKNPASIRCVSPRGQNKQSTSRSPSRQKKQNSEDSSDDVHEDSTTATPKPQVPAVSLEINGEVFSHHDGSSNDRPQSLSTGDAGLFVPSINVIPNTPVDPRSLSPDDERLDIASVGSGSTSGADDMSDKEELVHSSSPDDTDGEECDDDPVPQSEPSRNFACLIPTTPEQFAQQRNLILDTGSQGDDANMLAMAKERVIFQQRPSNTSLFSVNLGKMRSMRLFYSNPEYTCGQLVIASPDARYKILHFHHGGLDKLAQIFEQWNFIKAKSVKDGSPSPVPNRHLLICHPEVQQTELDPEDGLYARVNSDFWKSYMNQDGSIDDSVTVRKAVYFASMDSSLRKEVWPFLLRVYPWTSTVEQRESLRNDLFLEYQNIKKKRLKKMEGPTKALMQAVESSIIKDVVRTDRRNPFYAGDDNPNLETMKDILINYAVMYPDINYIQGMSDLLAPLLGTIKDESATYWCFSGLMQQTLFSAAPGSDHNMMDVNLEYLRDLLKLMVPDFYNYIENIGGDALQFMFVHRWILLFFKREFPEADALHIWEACWAKYRTSYFHLFVCAAIVSVYGGDVIDQKLPHDEILLYFASLAMHMDANVVLKKARGLLYQFHRLERIPCSLAGLLEQDDTNVHWTSHNGERVFECAKKHANNEPCPFAQS
uniref:Rab-GAP TBC domain-containing protein n=1 Tax=Panagrellus redivivus TaxID=6233 RepID=A0A7E4VK41_PANRE